MTRSFPGRYRSLFVTRVLVVAIVAVFGVNLGDALSPANASGLEQLDVVDERRQLRVQMPASGLVFAQLIVANGYWESFDGYERATSSSGALA